MKTRWREPKWRKGERGALLRTMNLKATGGPYIPAGTNFTVLRVRRTGELWVEIEGFGQRHVLAKHGTHVYRATLVRSPEGLI